jgi:nitrogen fixation protein FixH
MRRQTLTRSARHVTAIVAAALILGFRPSLADAQPSPGHDAMPQGASSPASVQPVQRLQPKRTLTVTGNEDWDALRGFGKDADMVAMMTLMMVGGSGMEHMKMRSMKPGSAGAASQTTGLPLTVSVIPNPPIVGDNTLDVMVADASGKPVTGLKLGASVAMTNMAMGTTRPKVVESPNGHYRTVVNFSMKGPWRVTLTGSAARKSQAVRTTLDFSVGSQEKWARAAGEKVILNTGAKALKVGKNTLEFTLLDAAGKAVTGARVTTAVAMTTMDMGTAHPTAQERSAGRYTSEVEFSMKGPWRVTLTITPPSQNPFTRSFDFNISK